MNFKPGQRVRIIKANLEPQLVGCEATIVRGPMPFRSPLNWYQVEIDGHPHPFGSQGWVGSEDQMVPLTDPKADAFVESIKKLVPAKKPELETC